MPSRECSVCNAWYCKQSLNQPWLVPPTCIILSRGKGSCLCLHAHLWGVKEGAQRTALWLLPGRALRARPFSRGWVLHKWGAPRRVAPALPYRPDLSLHKRAFIVHAQ